MLLRSVTTGKLGAAIGFSAENYLRVFADQQIWSLLNNSILYAAGSAALGTGIGAMLAWIVARTNTPGKRLVELMPLYPILMPPIMKNIAWILLLAPKSGILNNMIEQLTGTNPLWFNAFSLAGMIWVFGLACVPLGYLFLLPVFLSFDPSLEESAYIAGSKPVHTMLHITFPLAVPAFLSAFVLELFARPARVRNTGVTRHAGRYQCFRRARLRLHGFGIQHRASDLLQHGSGGSFGYYSDVLYPSHTFFRALRDDYRQGLSCQSDRYRPLEVRHISRRAILFSGGHRHSVHRAHCSLDDTLFRLFDFHAVSLQCRA